MTCISASEARALSIQAIIGRDDIVSSVVQLITTEALRGALHCDFFCSPPYAGVDSEFVEKAECVVRILERLGYKCKMDIFEPNEYFNLRVKIHIFWGNN